MDFLKSNLVWLNKPEQYEFTENKITFKTMPYTDLWQNTYYNFIHNNAHILYTNTFEQYFSFSFKTLVNGVKRFDQSGAVIYLDNENWLKASIEYENDIYQHLGSVVTNNGYSDWATTEIETNIKEIWYRLSRRESDFKIEYSFNGVDFKQMRICHLNKANDSIYFGIYACSPENSSFTSYFTDFKVSECLWKAHI